MDCVTAWMLVVWLYEVKDKSGASQRPAIYLKE